MLQRCHREFDLMSVTVNALLFPSLFICGVFVMKTLLATSIALILAQPVLAQTLQNGLIAHYEFEGNAKDSNTLFQNKHHGIEKGAIKYIEGISGFAAEFDGNPLNYIEVPHSAELNFNNTSFSISMWVYHEKDIEGSSAHVVSKGWDCKNGYKIDMGGSQFILRNNNDSVFGQEHWCRGSGVDSRLPKKEWQFVSIVFDLTVGEFGEIRRYINGVLKNTQNYANQAEAIPRTTTFKPATPIRYNPNNTHSLMIGRHLTPEIENGRYPYPFAGKIDDLRLYNRALNECEVKKLYDPVAYPDNQFNDKICTNQPPIADFTVTRVNPNLRTLQLDASSSKDNDGNIMKYEWLIQPDGLILTGKKPKITLPEGGVYEIILTVTDNKGAKNIRRLSYTLDDADCQGRAKYDVSNQTLIAPYIQVLDNTNNVVWIGEALFNQVPQSETLFNLSNLKELNPPPAIGTKVCPATYKVSTKTMKLPFIDIFQNGFPNMTYSGVLKDLDKKDSKDLFNIQNLVRKQ